MSKMIGRRILFIWIVALSAVGLMYHTSAQSQTDTTVSNVTIPLQLAMSVSPNLTDGVTFGNIGPGNDTIGDPGMGILLAANSSNNITAGSDNNDGMKLCIKIDNNLNTSTGVEILTENYLYVNHSNASYINVSSVLNSTMQNDTVGYRTANESIPANGVFYFGFWITIPSGQTPGFYNNTMSFRAVQAGQGC